MPHNNGIIYIDTSTTPPQGADVQGDIAKVLGSSSGDVATLWRHSSVNKWAKYKPVISSHGPSPLTDAMRAQLNQGFTTSKLHTATESALIGLAIENGFDWEYVHNSGFARVFDFLPGTITGNGYNHYATRPFTITNYSKVEPSPDTHTWFSVSWTYADTEIGLGDLELYTYIPPDEAEVWFYGVAYKFDNSQTGYFCPLVWQAGGSIVYRDANLMPAQDTPGSYTGYFSADVPAYAASVTAALCAVRLHYDYLDPRLWIPVDYMLLPTTIGMDFFVSKPIAQSTLAFVHTGTSQVYTIDIAYAYTGSYEPYTVTISLHFKLSVAHFSQMPTTNYTFTATLTPTSTIPPYTNVPTITATAQYNTSDFTVANDVGTLDVLVVFTPDATPIYPVDQFARDDIKMKLACDGEEIWFDLLATGGDMYESLPKSSTQVSVAFADIVTNASEGDFNMHLIS